MKTKENIRMQTSHDLESEQEHVMRSQIHVEQNCVQKKKKTIRSSLMRGFLRHSGVCGTGLWMGHATFIPIHM